MLKATAEIVPAGSAENAENSKSNQYTHIILAMCIYGHNDDYLILYSEKEGIRSVEVSCSFLFYIVIISLYIVFPY